MADHGMFLLVQVGLSGSFRRWLDVCTGNLLLEGFGMPLFERWDMKKWRSEHSSRQGCVKDVCQIIKLIEISNFGCSLLGPVYMTG
uniref:Uncharacterized protein n=1 Tax=Aegilops tauschii TaxID=37682 RepID=R7W7D9_AEGTA